MRPREQYKLMMITQRRATQGGRRRSQHPVGEAALYSELHLELAFEPAIQAAEESNGRVVRAFRACPERSRRVRLQAVHNNQER